MKTAISLLSVFAASVFFVPTVHSQQIARQQLANQQLTLLANALQPPAVDPYRQFRNSRPQPASAKLQINSPIRGDVSRLEYTFQGNANETVVIYWEGISSNVKLKNTTSTYLSEGQAYSLPNIELGEQADNHHVFYLEEAGEYQLSFLAKYTEATLAEEDPHYFIRVRSASESDRLMAEAAYLSRQSYDEDFLPLSSAASRLLDLVIEQNPQLP